MVLIIVGVIAAAILAGCAQIRQAALESGEQEMTYHKIDAKEAKRMIDEGDVTIVDVRTPGEYAERHLENALNVPNEEIADTPPEKLADKDARLIVYCRTGIRSKQASDKLVAMGYTNVFDMGGINDWPYETINEKGDIV
ncbi:hypothetical protein CE91St36_14200 [Christensenellaceae bacterium]|nr:hypothetical protein CE91St36_14200 [Christensenellaceae bacterium]